MTKPTVSNQSAAKKSDNPNSLNDSVVRDKYKTAARVANGISYPTSIAVNNIVCHFSPLESEAELLKPLAGGDVVKVQLGAHFDGYAAVLGHTVVVGASEANPVTGAKADLLAAAYYASEGILRMLKPGNLSTEISAVAQRITETFGCKPLEGSLCNNQMQNIIDGDKYIALNPNEDQRKKVVANRIEVGDVYMIDLFVSGGSAKTKPSETRTTFFKKSTTNYQLKMKIARAFYSEVTTNFGAFPFTLRSCGDERKARMGVIECVKSKVLDAYEVVEEKDGSSVAQVSFTVLVTENGLDRLTQGPTWNPKLVITDKKLDSETEKLLKIAPKSIKPSS
ncbi:Proliferation-associated protein 2G4 [Zancudomyces culisetae]|uniref:Proliferation-associated protein 2G4 n=1 Tax=Zancudomyces culisetae TaxID=1213189 RepID=A0A1R1PZ93_ZANCU|nr:Proliferation-associated protein 2G4 [Zancudomyces culisetae]|eukprot:OMH86278.1 Proliferation-associated protein 2G4 [Zancudomyces culisetae]